MSNPREPLRELLLARHRAAIPRLDASRLAAIARLRDEAPDLSLGELIRALFWPNRAVWLSLAVTWAALAVFRIAVRPKPDSSPHLTLSSTEIASWLAQNHSHEIIARTDHLD